MRARRAGHGLAVLAIWAALGCGSDRGATARGADEATGAGRQAPVGADVDGGADSRTLELDRVVGRALAVVSGLRELPAKKPVQGQLIERQAMLDYVRRQLKKEIPPAVLRASEELLYAFGTVSASFDYERNLLKMMGSQLAGYYDTDDETMYLAADLGEAERRATLSHELVHALQDQHYDLGALVEWKEDASDVQGAIHALAEGDATSAMMDELLSDRGLRAVDVPDKLLSAEARGSIELLPELADVPMILKRSLVAPYADGLELVHHLRRRGGWAAVDAVWKKPLGSTEQLLHPTKLEAREPPETVPIPAAGAQGPTKLAYHDVLGEQSLRILFEEWMPRAAAVSAASDWAGDRIAVYSDGGDRHAVAWRVRYDNERAALRGLEAFATGALRSGASDTTAARDAGLASRAGKVCRDRPEHGPFAAVRRARDVAVVLGPYRRRGQAVTGDGSCSVALVWAQVVAGQQ
jgi:hypothetical protein